jgi:hypothetical protein
LRGDQPSAGPPGWTRNHQTVIGSRVESPRQDERTEDLSSGVHLESNYRSKVVYLIVSGKDINQGYDSEMLLTVGTLLLCNLPAICFAALEQNICEREIPEQQGYRGQSRCEQPRMCDQAVILSRFG